MHETPEHEEHEEPDAEAFEAPHSSEDQAAIDALENRHRARVLIPLGIVILVAIFLGWLGPVGESAVQEPPSTADKSAP